MRRASSAVPIMMLERHARIASIARTRDGRSTSAAGSSFSFSFSFSFRRRYRTSLDYVV
jgi:hypothetical protein